MDEMLVAVLRRLHASQHATLQHGLLLVFIRLFVMNTDNIAGYLAGKDVTGSGTPELVYIIRLWAQEHETFKGSFKSKLSVQGLLKLFGSNNPALANLTVRGDLRVDPNAGRSSRAQSKRQQNVPQYAEEPLKLRIFKLFVRDHMVPTSSPPLSF